MGDPGRPFWERDFPFWGMHGCLSSGKWEKEDLRTRKECEGLKARMRAETWRNFWRSGIGGWEGAREEGQGRSCCTLHTSLRTLEFILGAVGRSLWICRGWGVLGANLHFCRMAPEDREKQIGEAQAWQFGAFLPGGLESWGQMGPSGNQWELRK